MSRLQILQTRINKGQSIELPEDIFSPKQAPAANNAAASSTSQAASAADKEAISSPISPPSTKSVRETQAELQKIAEERRKQEEQIREAKQKIEMMR